MNEDENIAKPMLEIVDKRIRKIVDEGADFRLLRDLYLKSFWEKIKDIAGTSAGFTGLSEYIILRTIMDFLEKELEVKFHVLEKTKDVRFFVSSDRKILITHSISINKGMKNAVQKKLNKEINWSTEEGMDRLQPDIVIFKLTNGVYEPKTIIQIKIYQMNDRVIGDEIGKLEKVATIGDPLMVILFFYEPTNKGVDELKEFTKNHPNRAFAILPNENVSFNEALCKIRNSLA